MIASGLPWLVQGQIVITNGVQTYATLVNTTVTMSNRCELRVTDASGPISGCNINLNSVDSYLVLPGIKPSVVAGSAYMNQIYINGAPAVADSNCRVVEYAMGAIVLPHPSNFQPLTVYSGPNFTGISMTLAQWTYYKSSLGAFYANISSFKLKRGYMAVMAQAENGLGVSKSYIAQDADMEVSLLPSSLENSIRFVYVTPWRWISKKSIAGWPGNVIMPSVQSWYNWRGISSSTRDLEYTAMRWGIDLPSLDAYSWQSQQINTVLGHNEPDQGTQSALTPSQSIADWPELQKTGLRIGAPAIAEGANSWLSSFMSSADASNLRVDILPLHDYACHDPSDPVGAANQLYGYLKGFYDTYHRPIWVTEWNSGANWTSCGDPTYAQEQALVAAMINMMDNTPWIERYHIYNWVESVRAVVDGSGNLTLAGQTYAAQQSPIGYVQTWQDNGTRSFTQLSFENNTLDSSGYGNNGLAAGSPAFTNGVHGQAIVFDGTNTIVTLPPNIATAGGFTFAAWINWGGGANFQRIFDFGNSMSEYMYLTPNSGAGLRFVIKDINLGEQSVQASLPLPTNSWVHVAVTLNGTTAILYTNGVQAASASVTYKPSDFKPNFNALGRCSTNTSAAVVPYLKGVMDDVFIADNAISATAVAELVTNTPPQFTTNLLDAGTATQGVAYSNSISGAATDADGQAVGYSKVTGPAWLSIAANGALTGTPTAADGGTNYFTVTVTDSTGGGPGVHSFAVVQIVVALTGNNNSAVWGLDGSTNWGFAGAWTNQDPPSGLGQTADFSTINITANRTVTLDSSRIIGTLKFNDTSGIQTWLLTNSGSSTLTLDSGSSISPTVEVNNQVMISALLAGTNGFTKTGLGTLTLSGNNLYLAGSLNVAQGTVVVGGTYALGAGFVTMSGGSISNAATYTIENPVNVVSNGTFSVGSGATLTLTGAITNSGGITKVGAGTLKLSSASSYTGNTFLNTGTLDINNASPIGYSTLVINGGSLDNSDIRSYTVTANNPQVWNGSFSFIGTDDLNLGTGPVTLNGNPTVTINGANTLTIGGAISGAGGFTKAGGSILYLSGTGTYTGGTTLSAGELQIANSSALGTGSLMLNGGTLTARQANRTLNNAVTIGGDFTLGGVNGGGNTLTLAGAVDLGGASRTITVDESGGAVISGQISNGGLIKAGSSVLTLAGAIAYTGDTAVNAGTLALNQPALPPSGTVTVISGAILNLNFNGTNQVAGLVLNGVSQPSGVYNAANSSLFIAGTGNLLVAGTPAIPSGLVAIAGDAQVALSWNASSGATSYNVKRSTTSGGPYNTIATPTATSYTDTTVVNGTTYFYVVSAVNTGGESANSSQVSATPVPPIPPTPTGLTAMPGDNQVALSWAAASGATSYNVKRATTSGGPYSTISSPTVTSYTDVTAVGGTTYYYVVSAVNAGGESANSSQVSAMPTNSLPAPWVSADIGSVGAAGNASYSSGTFTVSGSGVDIGGTADEFRYVYQTSSGDCEMRARVATLQNTDPLAKAGVMIRESTAAGARFTAVVVTPNNGVQFLYRTKTGGSTTTVTVTGITVPQYVRIQRTSSNFAAYYSSNGTTWAQIGTTQRITMATSVTIGMAVTSHNDGVLCTSTMDNVTATP